MSRSLDAEKRVKNAETIRTILTVTLFDGYVSLIQLILIRICDQCYCYIRNMIGRRSKSNYENPNPISISKIILT